MSYMEIVPQCPNLFGHKMNSKPLWILQEILRGGLESDGGMELGKGLFPDPGMLLLYLTAPSFLSVLYLIKMEGAFVFREVIINMGGMEVMAKEEMAVKAAQMLTLHLLWHFPISHPTSTVIQQFLWALSLYHILLHVKTFYPHSTSTFVTLHLDHCSNTWTNLLNSPFFPFNLCSDQGTLWNLKFYYSIPLHETEPCISVRKLLDSPDEM